MDENRTVIKVEGFKPCRVCGKSTPYIDYCFEERLCSKECDDKFVEMICPPFGISHGEQEEV